jgi:hypothetical protein
VGSSLAAIRQEMQHDGAFLARVVRAEASVEFNHMRNVQDTAKTKKDWRASVWWLERRSPERFARRNPGVITSRQLKAFVTILVDTLRDAVTCDADRERIMARLQSVAQSVEQMLSDAETGRSEPWDIESSSPATTADEHSTSDLVVQRLLDFDGAERMWENE